ncbi:all trans-polyprenyl-diphosphate synthase PDSS2-like isoform X1 [Mytilus edulis]|uniref:all trans-polyprenyl-diphosphate synthase PDSS2-like isoform X1 n=1 Tax=Mytilus edulis TaxID=6550 RepID=UPI0039EFDB47
MHLSRIFRSLSFMRDPIFLLKSHHIASHSKSFPRKCFGIWSSKKVTEWNKAVSDAEKLVGYPTSLMGLRCFLSDEISNVAIQMRKLVGSKHPLLQTARGLIYNDSHTLQTRGLIVLLVCKAAGQPSGSDQDIDNSQRALAEITEMIYTACLIHKGVVNMSDFDRVDEVLEGMSSGNKMATLTGDFLLANACTELARLENTQVVENISCAIGNSMEAEFTKIKNSKTDVTFDDWLDQTYLTSGSLLAHSCQSALLLVGHNESYQTAAFNLGKNLAITRQLYEDINRFTQPETDDISPNILSTAPGVLYLGNRSLDFTQELLEDPREQKKILKKIKDSGELQQCKDLCKQYGVKARQSLHVFEQSVPRDALFRIINATTVS